MTDLGQTRKSAHLNGTSVLPPTETSTDERAMSGLVAFWIIVLSPWLAIICLWMTWA